MRVYALKQYYNENSNGDTIGLFEDLNEALYCVENNSLDLSDSGYYKYVVIFPVDTTGLYYIVDPDDEKWFVWDKETRSYVLCTRPSFMDHFAILL